MNSIKKAGNPLRAPARLICSLLFSFLFLFSASPVSAQYQKTQKAVSAKINSSVNGYYESLPVDYASNPSKKYPLLVFIHGKGELGNGTTQLNLVLRNGPPKLLNEGKFPSSFTVGGKSFSFIVISPQLVSNDYANSPEIINDVINYCKQKYRVDEQRVYLTGLSMGGTMTWDYGSKTKEYANTLAAGLTVCGSISNSAGRINIIAGSQLPIWATINSGDPIISVPANTAAISALNAFVPTPPKSLISIFSASGHDAWTKTYDPNFKQGGLNVYEWMLSYSRGTTTPPLVTNSSSLKTNAGTNQTITLPASSVILDGSASVYPSGSTIQWTKISGPSGGEIVSPGYVKTTIKGLTTQGDYQFQLKITDPGGGSSTSSVHVIVNTTPPSTLKANAGSKQTITLPTSSVILDGSASVYPSGSTIQWTKISGPSGGEIVSPGYVKTTIKGLNTQGDYQFQLKITDPGGGSSTSSVHVIVNTTSPSSVKANAGADQTLALFVNSVILDGSASVYPSGSTIQWTKISGPSGGEIVSPGYVKTTVKGLNTQGDYQFQLKIIDPDGNSSTSSVHVIASSSVKANAGADQTIMVPTSSVILDGSVSIYPSGSTIQWTKISGPSGGEIISPGYVRTTVRGLNTQGDYQFQLKITDPDGNSFTSSVHVIVTSPSYRSSILTANAGADQIITVPASSVILDGSVSVYPSGSTIQWTKISGPSGGEIISPGYVRTTIRGLNTQGDYQFQLKITDRDGNISTSAVHVMVVPTPPSSLKADAGADQTITVPASSLILDGSVSVYPSGSTIQWTKIGGPSGGEIVSPGYVRTTIKELNKQGDYRFQLKITDRDGNISTSAVQVMVAPTPPSFLAANAGADQTITVPASSVILDGSVSVYPSGSTIQWTKIGGPSGGEIVSPGYVRTTIKELNKQGDYRFQLKITDPAGNVSTSSVHVIVQPAGTKPSARTASLPGDANNETSSAQSPAMDAISNIPKNLELKVFPNPVQSDMQLLLDGQTTGRVSIILYNTQGQPVFRKDFVKDNSGSVNKSINLSKLPTGIYVLQAIVEDGHKQTIRIVKQ